ncbi:MAG: SLC13 family permease [Gemmatimonadota bacterium]
MTLEMGIVFAVIALALALFISERFPVDQVALALPVVLLLAGLITPAEAVSGFSNEATVTVTAMLVLSLGLVKTGAVATIGRWAVSAPLGGPRLRLAILCGLVAVLSAFLNNTPVVVVFLPVFLGLAQQFKQPPSLYLMPLSFSAILGGTVTLIGTSTNLVVYGLARDRGFDDLSMFSMTPLGLIYLAVGMTYMLTIGHRLLPRRHGPLELSGKYEVRRFVMELRVLEGSPAAGRSLADLRWGELYGVSVLGIHRGDRTIWAPGPRRRALAGDMLYAQGNTADLLRLAAREKLAHRAVREGSPLDLGSDSARLVELLVGPRSPLIGQTLRDVRFQQRYDATVLAIQHHGRTVRDRLAEVRLEAGDLLLVHGPGGALDGLAADEEGFIPLSEVRPPGARHQRAGVAVTILVAVVAAAGVGIPILPAALTGVVAMLFTRCVRIEEIRSEVDWMIVFLLAGVIPLGVAMDRTGAAEWIGHGAAELLGPLGPTATVAGFYLLTSFLTAVMSNTATAIVLTPIALETAAATGMNPYALLVTVMFAASCDFSTPIGYQTNTLIYGPGGYRFSDYLRVGLPLSALLVVTAALLIPVFWPS